MKVDYNIPLQVVANSMRHYHHVQVETELADGIDFFPSVDMDEVVPTEGCTLWFNPKVQVILALYNLSMFRGINTGEAIVHYVLFHAFLEVDDYAGADRHLEAFRHKLSHLLAPLPSIDDKEESAARLLLQLYFTLFHESFHIILHLGKETRLAATAVTRELLRDIAAEQDDMHSAVSNEELIDHPKTRQHIAAMIPDGLSEATRKEREREILESLSQDSLNSTYIARVLESDSIQVEEITCDRQAWINLVPILQAQGATDADVLSVHMWVFTVLNAMDFNKVLQSQFIPSRHARSSYDARRVLLRHKAFKTLLRQYHPDIAKNVTTEYLDLHKGLESIYRSSVMALERYAKDLQQIYYRHHAGHHQPDFVRHRRLESEMTEAASPLFDE
ncbi:MAG: hypothetical protein ACI3X4_08240 [Bacteroidaceae bacterium]